MKSKLMIGMMGVVAVCACLYGGEDKPVELFPVAQGGKWGYIDKTGKIAIKPQFDCAWDFAEGLASVQVGMKRGYIDANGEMVIKPQFDLSRPFSEGVAAVYTNAPNWGDFIIFNYGSGNWGYIDKTGKTVITPKAQVRAYADEFHEGYARVCYPVGRSVYDGMMSRDGTIRTKVWYAYLGVCSEGLAAYQLPRDKFGYIDTNCVEVIGRIYERAGEFSEGLAPVSLILDVNDPARTATWTKAGKYNLGMRNTPPNTWATNAIPLDDGDSIALGATKTFTFQVTAPMKTGKYNFQWQMQAGGPFGDLSSNVTVTVTNTPTTPVEVAPPKTDAAPAAAVAALAAPASGKRPENGARFVSQSVPDVMTTGQTYTVSLTMKNTGPREAKWGYIDRTGKTVIEHAYQGASPFASGLAVVKEDGKWGYIDKTGKMAIRPQYESANKFSEGLARVVVGGKHGFIDAAGKMAIEPKFDCGWEFSKGLARVIVGDLEGYVDKTGKYVWEPTR
jgi:hypothetical protein